MKQTRVKYLTASVIRTLLGLDPVSREVPEIREVCDEVAKHAVKKSNCLHCGDKYTLKNPPPQLPREVSKVIMSLPDHKKKIILDTLRIDVLKGFPNHQVKPVDIAVRST